MPTPRVIYWFRTDLRLHDSPALKAALDLSPGSVGTTVRRAETALRKELTRHASSQ